MPELVQKLDKPPQDVLEGVLTTPMLSTQEFTARMENMDAYMSIAEAAVERHFRRFPKAKSISINLGFVLGVQAGMTVTWVRPD